MSKFRKNLSSAISESKKIEEGFDKYVKVKGTGENEGIFGVMNARTKKILQTGTEELVDSVIYSLTVDDSSETDTREVPQLPDVDEVPEPDIPDLS